MAPHWLRNLYKLSSFVAHFPPIYNNLPTISKPFIIYSLICRLSPIYYHCRPLSWTIHIHIIFIFIQFQVRPTRHPINMSVWYKTLSILYIFATFSTTPFPHNTDRLPPTSPIRFTIIIFIMETVFRLNHQQFSLCIIIHLLIFVMKFIQTVLHNYSFELHKYSFFGFHYGNHFSDYWFLL